MAMQLPVRRTRGGLVAAVFFPWLDHRARGVYGEGIRPLANWLTRGQASRTLSGCASG